MVRVAPAVTARTWLAVAACCLAMFGVGDNSTALMAAVPSMGRELGAGPLLQQWIVNAYMLASAACIVVGGRAADRFGARATSIAGFVLFAAGSMAVAVAHAMPPVLAGRVLQGIGAALAVPGTLAAVRNLAPDAIRPLILSIWAAVLVLGFSLGPLTGGLLVHYAGWRTLFLLSALLMLLSTVGLLAAGTTQRTTGNARQPNWRSADLWGFALLAVAMVALIFGLHGLAAIASRPLAALGPLGLATVALAALYRVERRVRSPLLDLDLLARRELVIGCVVGAIAMAGIMAFLFYDNLYGQSAAGGDLSPVSVGLSIVPLSLALLGFALATPRLTAALGMRAILMAAMALLAIAMAGLITAVMTDVPLVRIASLVMAGAGLAVPYASASRLALAALPPENAGQASGVVSACTFLGGSAGVACGGLAFHLGGLPGVLAIIGVLGVVGIVVARAIPGGR